MAPRLNFYAQKSELSDSSLKCKFVTNTCKLSKQRVIIFCITPLCSCAEWSMLNYRKFAIKSNEVGLTFMLANNPARILSSMASLSRASLKTDAWSVPHSVLPFKLTTTLIPSIFSSQGVLMSRLHGMVSLTQSTWLNTRTKGSLSCSKRFFFSLRFSIRTSPLDNYNQKVSAGVEPY